MRPTATRRKQPKCGPYRESPNPHLCPRIRALYREDMEGYSPASAGMNRNQEEEETMRCS